MFVKSKIQDYLFFILILVNSFINLIGGEKGGNYFFVTSLIILVGYGLTVDWRFKFNFISRMYFVIVLTSSFSLVYAQNTEYVLDDLPRVISNFFVIVIASTYLENKRRLIKTLVFSVLCALFLAIPNLIFVEPGVREMFWGGVNPVGTLMFFAVLFTTLLTFIKDKKFLILIPIFIAVILFTQSQKVIITLLLIYSILFLYILYFKSLKTKVQITSLVVIAGSIIFLLINNTAIGDSFLRTEATIQQIQTGESVTGSAMGSGLRGSLIDLGFSYFIDKPFFGYGLNQSRQLLLTDIGRSTYTHNTLVELLVSFGFFITFFYYLIYFFIMKKLYLIIKKWRTTLFFFMLISIIGILIVSYFQKTFYEVNTHLFLLICLFLINNKSYFINEN